MNSMYVLCTKTIIHVNPLRWSQLTSNLAKNTTHMKCLCPGTTKTLIKESSVQEKWYNDTMKLLNAYTSSEQEGKHQYQHSSKHCSFPVFWWASIWTWLGLAKDEESPEDKLITTIKRSILCMQRAEYDKAEQMLHLALRMAQDIRSRDGVTYVYDVMANLAMEREQFRKAEKLFVDVMKRLLSAGYADDSPKVLHISSKLAHMAHLQGELEKAKIGFVWTLEKIEECIRKSPDDLDVQELWGLTRNWFGQLLMKQGRFKEAKKNFQQAYDCLMRIRGVTTEDAITILNNLSVACVNMDNFDEAKKYLLQALQSVKELKDEAQECVLYANLGLIHLREGLLEQAHKCCTYAWKVGKKQNNNEAIEQAEYCLKEISDYRKQEAK